MSPIISTDEFKFQPTLPARGATGGTKNAQPARNISTHAPRTGSDTNPCAAPRRWARHFNPRSPHGERRWAYQPPVKPVYFNPRSPHGERPIGGMFSASGSAISTHAPRTGSDARAAGYSAAPSSFQPTLPARGATGRWTMAATCPAPFQPTLPARGATFFWSGRMQSWNISTHAPRTGSDHYRARPHTRRARFQPTLPARGATRLR